MRIEADSRSRRLVLCAMLAGVGLMLSYVESLVIPSLVVPLPGVKLGLSSCAVTIALYMLGAPYAAGVMLVRVIVASLLFGFNSLIFSLCGGILSLATMILAKRLASGTLSPTGVSILGAAAHNIGQTLAAAIVLGNTAVLAYLPALLICADAAGGVTGLICTQALYVMSDKKY